MCSDGLHPEVKAFIRESGDGPQIRHLPPQAARRRSERALKDSDLLSNSRPVGKVRELTVSGPAGDIPLRVYQPSTDGPHPVMIWLHGGGWVVGSLDAADPTCRYLVDEVDVTVVSVEYRLAPEHPFPEPLEDVYRVLEWVSTAAATIDSNDSRLIIGGVSAGANLAAAAALLSRERGGPDLAAQVLGVPPTDSGCNSPSYSERAEGGNLTSADMRYLWDCYLASDIDARNPYASPLHERDFSGLPPAIVVTSEYDPLRDDGKRYAERMVNAGGIVFHHHYDDTAHCVLDDVALLTGVSPTRRAFADVAQSLRDVLCV